MACHDRDQPMDICASPLSLSHPDNPHVTSLISRVSAQPSSTTSNHESEENGAGSWASKDTRTATGVGRMPTMLYKLLTEEQRGENLSGTLLCDSSSSNDQDLLPPLSTDLSLPHLNADDGTS